MSPCPRGMMTAALVFCMTWAAQNTCGLGGVSHWPGELSGGVLGFLQTNSSPLFPGEAQPRKLHPIPIPAARCYTYSWDQDNFGKRGVSPSLLMRAQPAAPRHSGG